MQGWGSCDPGSTPGAPTKLISMEDHLKNRPDKKILPIDAQIALREMAINKIKECFLPNSKIKKIILIGSSVKGTFGGYEAPGFRGSLFSDFDFIFIVNDDYCIPDWLKKEPDGKPFPDNKLNLTFRQKKFIDNKYDCEIFFIRVKNANNVTIQELAEKAGIPLKKDSEIKHLTVYLRQFK